MTQKKKLILLFFPNPFPRHRHWSGAPLALLAISRLLDQEQKYDIRIFTEHLTPNAHRQILRLGKRALCLGVSAMTGSQITDGLALSQKFKKRYPKIPIVWGGWHPSILPQQTVANRNVDIVVRGAGDITFTELVHALDKKKPLTNILGITYKRYRVIYNNPDRSSPDLSQLPKLPYHLIDTNRCSFTTEYGLRTLPYISSYGCPHRCAFCVEEIVNKRHWTPVPAQTVLDEWESLIKNYQADSVAVYDSNFFVDEKRVREICQGLIDRGMHLRWGNANGRAGQLSRYQESTWDLMERTGCAMILTGAESGSQNALDLITKDMNVEEIVSFTKKCAHHHIKILYSFLVGLPWSRDASENDRFVRSEYQATLGLIDKLLKISNRNRYTYYVFLPYPGAPLFHRAISLGLQCPDTLDGWSQYLMSPEDAFKETIRQKWISHQDAQLTAMLTQYIFGIMDRDTYDMLLPRIHHPLSKALFTVGYFSALAIVTFRWRHKFFGIRLDYRLFTLVHKYGGLI